MKPSQRALQFYSLTVLTTVLLLLPAIWNGYPILNPDDNTYLLSGFLPDTPIDRPIAYGLLMRAMSLNGVSLWCAIVLQAWCVAWLVQQIIMQYVASDGKFFARLFVACFLACFTSLSWITSELIPDVCTPLAGMSLALLLLGKKKNTVTLFVLFTLAICTHFSHLLIFSALLLTVVAFRRKWFPAEERRFRTRNAAIAFGLTLASVATMGSSLSKSKYAFAMGAMHAQGILKPYLDEHCPTEHYKLCQYKDVLPASSDDLLWDPQSPLQKDGSWAGHKSECKDIYYGSLKEPKYLMAHISASIRLTALQLTSFGIGDGNTPFARESPIDATVQKYLSNDVHAFRNAGQQRGSLLPELHYANTVINLVVIASLMVVAYYVVLRRRRVPASLQRLSLLFVLLIMVNAWDCATFSQVIGRYEARVMWLLPLGAMLLLMGKQETGTQMSGSARPE